jgi:membrane glycosyltransferase
VEAWKSADPDRERIVYRRRGDNTGFKAGNVRDFCARWGKDYALMLPLDADSLMSGEQVVRLVRMMQAHPKIGILQSLVVGMPSASAFARIFQFGMRHGMRSYTMGQAWWVGDCGPFWGHNALVRIKPFHEQCDLPMLPGKPPLGGHLSSRTTRSRPPDAPRRLRGARAPRGARQLGGEPAHHAGVRPPRRALVPGQHAVPEALDLPGLYPMSRFQLVWAILMFIGIPAWTLMIALLPVAAWEGRSVPDFPSLSPAASTSRSSPCT